MNPERWQRIEAIFYRALELEPATRQACLEAQCAGDDTLRHEVDALLRSERVAGSSIRQTIEQEAERFLQGRDASGERLGAWRLLRPLQHGGMGAVYLAERADDVYRKKVAIKVLRHTAATHYERERLRAERQILANLEHPGIARLIDGGTRADGTPYLVMEYVEGEPIDRYCTERGLGIEERLRLFREVCLAVAHAHGQHVVHRDLKPANILVGKDGLPKLLDFGIAKLLEPMTDPASGPPTRAQDRRLTPGYASPEQLSGTQIGYASDIYALGVVLYELLAGCLPYQLEGLSFDEMLLAIRRSDPLLPSAVLEQHRPDSRDTARRLRGDLDNIVMKALQHDPSARYASAGDLAADIERHLANEPVLARPAPPGARLTRFLRRNRMASIAALAVIAAGVSTALYVKAMHDGERRIDALIASRAAAQANANLPSIAVLPFGSAESGSMLGVALSRQLSRSLSSLNQLRVTAYNSVRRSPDGAPHADTAARELGVRYVVSGSAEANGGRLRVEATLIDTATGQRLWTVRHDGALEDLFAIRTQIAEKVVSALRIELSADERRRIGAATSRNVEAYLAMLRGLSSYGRRLRHANDEARRHFEHAIALDPRFATAHGLLALIYLAEHTNDWGDDPAQSLARAEHLAKRALALGDDDAPPHVAMGMVRLEQRRHGEALEQFARAAELDPNYANALVLTARTLCYAGKTATTIELIHRAKGLNPRFPINYSSPLGLCYFAMGRYPEAVAAFEHGLDRNALRRRALLLLAASYAQAGRLAQAQSALKEIEPGERELTLSRIEPTILFARGEDRKRVLDGLRLAGIPDR